jgi:hypothetical protein
VSKNYRYIYPLPNHTPGRTGPWYGDATRHNDDRFVLRYTVGEPHMDRVYANGAVIEEQSPSLTFHYLTEGLCTELDFNPFECER